jgi:hypothetical protein
MTSVKLPLAPKAAAVDWALVDSCAHHLEALYDQSATATAMAQAADFLRSRVLPSFSSWTVPESSTPEQLLSLFRLSQAIAELNAFGSTADGDESARDGFHKKPNIKEHTHMLSSTNLNAEETCFARFVFRQVQTDSEKVWGRAEVAAYKGQFIKSDVLDDIFCKRWNLPPPKLIISVTGSADEYTDEDKQKEAATARFIKNCIYASAVDSKSCWIFSGGSNSGIMRLLGDARRQLGGWGDQVRLGTAQVALCGIGVGSRMKFCDSTLDKMTGDQTQDVSSRTMTLDYQPAVFEKSIKDKTKTSGGSSYVPDPGHSHLLYLNGKKYGDEVKQRTEAELHFSAKFKVPIIYVVLGGGDNTVKLVQECIQKGAFCVILKGSGRAADVIAECKAQKEIHPEKDNCNPFFWKLHGEEINRKKGEQEYKLQDWKARYMSIVNSKYVQIFDPETASFDEMCSAIKSIEYSPLKNMFGPVTLANMSQLRHVSTFVPIAKNLGFEVKGFFVGPPRNTSRRWSGRSSHVIGHGEDYVKSTSLSDAAFSSFSDMLVSMMRRYSTHHNAPDVFVTLLISQDDASDCAQDHPCVLSFIRGIGMASYSCLVWSFLDLHPSVSSNVMKHNLDMRMKLEVSLDSFSVIAFSDSNLQRSVNFDNSVKSSLQKDLNDCPNGASIPMSVCVEDFLSNHKDRGLFQGIDEVFFAANDEIGEKHYDNCCLKQHVVLRLEAESYVSTVHRSSGIYALCGGDFIQCMSKLQWCCSQRCHVLIFADSGGFCPRLVQAVALHKCLFSVANRILDLCWDVVGEPDWEESRVYSIDHTIALCHSALEKIKLNRSKEKPGHTLDLNPLLKKLKHIVHQLLSSVEDVHDPNEGIDPGSALCPEERNFRHKPVQPLNGQRFFSPQRVHPQLPEHVAAQPASSQHSLITQGMQLLHEYANSLHVHTQNPYDLWKSEQTVEMNAQKGRRNSTKSDTHSDFDLRVRDVLSRLKQLQWHTAIVREFQSAHSEPSSVLFDESVMTMVNLIEKCNISVVFAESEKPDDLINVKSEKLVAQCILRRAIESPSSATGQLSVDMFGETSLMVAVAKGNKKLVHEILSETGADVHYICRCSSHPTAFGMNALLVAVMLQLPELADAILNKLLTLMSYPYSVVFLQEGRDSCQINVVEYIQDCNPTAMQDCISSRHPEYHLTALMFACRWGYAQLLPKFFELLKLQENLKTTAESKGKNEKLVRKTPFERNKRIMQSISTEYLGGFDKQAAGEEVFEARSQSEFRMLLLGDSNQDFGLDINARSALHHAVLSGSVACVKFCMEHGADALCENVKFSINHIRQHESHLTATEEYETLEFQEMLEEYKIDCRFSTQELRYLHKSQEFDAYKLKMNIELSSAIHSAMFAGCFGSVSARLKKLVDRDRVASSVSSVAHHHKQGGIITIWTTKCSPAFDVALFSWNIHGILLNRKTVELAHQVHSESLTTDVIALQQAKVRLLNRNQNKMQDCVNVLLGKISYGHTSKGDKKDKARMEVQKSESKESSEAQSFSSRGCHLVYKYTRNKAYIRTILPLLLRVGVIILFFVFCNLINAGISPRESRLFAQTYIRNIRNTYADSAQPDVTKIQTLEHFSAFISDIEPILSAPEYHPVRRIGSVRMSFLFDQQTACTGLTSGICSSHYTPLNDGTMFMNAATIPLASSEHDIRSGATAKFMEFSISNGARFQNVEDCGYTYCFNALALQLRLNDSPGFNSTWSLLKDLLPEQSSLRFVQLGFLLHSPTIEQIMGVRLLFEIQGIADISVHDRFTSFHIAPHTPQQRSWYLQRYISIALFLYILHRLIWFGRNISHEWHETVTAEDGIRATFRRYAPVMFFCSNTLKHPDASLQNADNAAVTRGQAYSYIFMHYIPKLIMTVVSSIIKFHAIVEFVFCILGLLLLILSEEIQLYMQDNFNIGDAPQNPALFADLDLVTPLLDGNVGRTLRWGRVSLELLLSWRRDLMAWAILALFSTLFKHLERLPVLGPKLRAIIAVLRDSVLAVFLALIFIVSLAYAMSAYVGFSLDTNDKDDIAKSSLEILFLRAFNQILAIDTQTDFAFTRHGYAPDTASGLAGFYYIFTAVIGNLVLSNLIITVIGDCYSLALEFNPETDWTIELNRFLGRQLVLKKLEYRLVERLRREGNIVFTSLFKLEDCIDALGRSIPAWSRFFTRGSRWLVRRVIYVLTFCFESGWSPYGLELYPDNDELQLLYNSVEIWKLHGDTADIQ